MSEPLLAAEGLGLDVRLHGTTPAWRTILRDLSFSLPRAGALGVIGESGSGKSTLARALTLLMPPQRGKIRFARQDVTALRGTALTEYRARVQLVFQDPMSALNPRRRVGVSIVRPLQALGRLRGR